jgi:hypothetical protein
MAGSAKHRVDWGTKVVYGPGPKGFKNIVYIALKPAGPNLPFPDSDTHATFPTYDQESRLGGASDESSDSDEIMASVKPENDKVNAQVSSPPSKSCSTVHD